MDWGVQNTEIISSIRSPLFSSVSTVEHKVLGSSVTVKDFLYIVTMLYVDSLNIHIFLPFPHFLDFLYFRDCFKKIKTSFLSDISSPCNRKTPFAQF